MKSYYQELKNLKKNELINFIHNWIYNRDENKYLRKLYKDVKRERLIDKTIIFNTVRCFKNIVDRELFLGKLLALNGAKVIILMDNGVLKHWDSYQINDIKNIHNFDKYNYNPYPEVNLNHSDIFKFLKNVYDKNLYKKSLKTYKDQNIEIIFYKNIINNINYDNWQELKKFAESSTIRFFKTSELDYSNKLINYYYRLSLKNAILSRNVGEYVLNKIKPDFFVTSHGIYSTWGPAFEFLKQNGINCLVYAGIHSHPIIHNQIFFSTTKIQLLSRSKFWEDFKSNPTTEKMKKKIEEYFIYRINFLTTDTKILYKDKRTLLRVNKNDGYRYHIALFPNVIWDGNIKDRHIIFKGLIDWIISTINYIKRRKDIKLFIKSHPSEITVLENSPKIADLIKNYFNFNDIENIELIPPEKKIDTYEFLKSGIDLGICYDNFLSLEIPYLKIPTLICVPNGSFSVEGGNIIVKSKTDYFNYLENIDKVIEEFHMNYNKHRNNIVKYLYWYLFRISRKLPTISKKNVVLTDLKQVKKEDIILSNKLLKIFS